MLSQTEFDHRIKFLRFQAAFLEFAQVWEYAHTGPECRLIEAVNQALEDYSTPKEVMEST